MSMNFLIISLVFVLGYMGFIKAIWSMMQEKGLFDMVSGGRYSKWLDGLYSGSDKQKMLCKIMGGCEQCTSFWWYLPYSFLYSIAIHYSAGWQMPWVLVYIWYMVFWFICSMAALFTLTHNTK